MKAATLLMVALALTVASTGCRKKPGNITPLPGRGAQPMTDIDRAGMLGNQSGVDSQNPSGIAMTEGQGHPGWHEDAQTLQAQTVHFAYDSAVVKQSEESKIEAVASYLKNNSAAAVKVEGNCDERGTEEYNRALGERRALAVREALVHMGIDPTRIDTISYGEDKPADSGHDESAYAKNRRADFVVLTPP